MKTTEVGKPRTDGRRPYRRRKYLIKPAFQWKYAITAALAVFLISCMMTTLLYGVLHHQARQRSLHPQGYVAEVSLVVCVSALAFAVLTAGGVGLWCIILTHRVCGPLYVMEKFLSGLAKGRLPKLRPLRRKDEFKDFYEVFSRALGSLEARKRTELATLTRALEIAQPAADADEVTCREALDSVATCIEKLRVETAAALGEEVEAVRTGTAGRHTGSPGAPHPLMS